MEDDKTEKFYLVGAGRKTGQREDVGVFTGTSWTACKRNYDFSLEIILGLRATCSAWGSQGLILCLWPNMARYGSPECPLGV